jgi:hypothetical protein
LALSAIEPATRLHVCENGRLNVKINNQNRCFARSMDVARTLANMAQHATATLPFDVAIRPSLSLPVTQMSGTPPSSGRG